MTPEERLAAAMTAPEGESRAGRNVAAAGELALMMLPFTRVGRAMMSTLPRAAGTGLGAGALIEGSRGNLPLPSLVSEAEAQTRQRSAPPSEAVMKLHYLRRPNRRLYRQERPNVQGQGAVGQAEGRRGRSGS
jgi:hypothetical protein